MHPKQESEAGIDVRITGNHIATLEEALDILRQFDAMAAGESVEMLYRAMIGKSGSHGDLEQAIRTASPELQRGLIDQLAMMAEMAVIEAYAPMNVLRGEIAAHGDKAEAKDQPALTEAGALLDRFVNTVEQENALAAWPLMADVNALDIPDEWAAEYVTPALMKLNEAADELQSAMANESEPSQAPVFGTKV